MQMNCQLLCNPGINGVAYCSTCQQVRRFSCFMILVILCVLSDICARKHSRLYVSISSGYNCIPSWRPSHQVGDIFCMYIVYVHDTYKAINSSIQILQNVMFYPCQLNVFTQPTSLNLIITIDTSAQTPLHIIHSVCDCERAEVFLCFRLRLFCHVGFSWRSLRMVYGIH